MRDGFWKNLKETAIPPKGPKGKFWRHLLLLHLIGAGCYILIPIIGFSLWFLICTLLSRLTRSDLELDQFWSSCLVCFLALSGVFTSFLIRLKVWKKRKDILVETEMQKSALNSFFFAMFTEISAVIFIWMDVLIEELQGL